MIEVKKAQKISVIKNKKTETGNVSKIDDKLHVDVPTIFDAYYNILNKENGEKLFLVSDYILGGNLNIIKQLDDKLVVKINERVINYGGIKIKGVASYFLVKLEKEPVPAKLKDKWQGNCSFLYELYCGKDWTGKEYDIIERLLTYKEYATTNTFCKINKVFS